MKRETDSRQPFPANSSLGHTILWIASVAIVYFATARMSLSMVFQPEGIAAIWPAEGIFLSAILLTRPGVRPYLVGVLVITDLIAELLTGTPFPLSVVYSLTLAGDAVLGSWLLIRFVGEPITFGKVREVSGFLFFAVILSNCLMSLVAAAAAHLVTGSSFWDSWRWWAASDGIGNLVVTPFLLSWASSTKSEFGTWDPKRMMEGTVLFVSLVLLNHFAFTYLPEPGQFELVFAYLSFPLLLWAAMRFGMRGVTAVLVMLAAISIRVAVAGRIPGISVQNFRWDVMIDLHLYLAALAIPSLFLAAVMNERRQSEEKIRESQNLLRAVVEGTPDAIYVKDLQGCYLLFNSGASRFTGKSAAEAIGNDDTALFPAAEARTVMEGDRGVIDSGESMTYEELLTTAEGETRTFLSTKGPIHDERGNVTGLFGIARDISDRKRAEEVLKAQLAFRKGIVECVAEGICVCHNTPDFPFVSFTVWNNRMLEITGYSIDEINRLGWYQSLYPDPDVRARARDRMDRMRQGDNLQAEEWEITRSDGVQRLVSISTSLLYEQDTSVHVLALMQDVTDRKRAEEEKRGLELQVQQAQKMESLGVLAGGIAHDFNNILMAVLGHAELALVEMSPMSPARGNLAEIATAARRAADLCRQMLAYAGKASFAPERVGLRELVEEMAHLLKTAISKKAILNLNLERGLPPVQADPSQIRQIVMNLIINASEAIGDRSGVITVSVGATPCDEEYLKKTELHDDLAPGLYVHLEVADTGGGMDAGTRSRVFEPFFTTKFAGRGLGLAAVLGIVRAHKGAVKMYSEPGKGTTFKILFPALTEGEDATLSSGAFPLSDWRGKGTILLVDDEESLLALGARMLEHLGFSVLTAADGLQAVQLYRERGKEIDLVLMDLTMPHMDGAEAFGELRRLNPDVRVILASGYSHEDVASRFAGKGLAGVLQKPYTLAKLRESLADLKPAGSSGDG